MAVSSNPAYKDRAIHHNAGLGGFGGSGYTDAVLMRDADLSHVQCSGAWSGAADGTAGFAPTRRVGCNIDRQYYSNNLRGDVVAILDDTGRMIEQVRYTPYGVPFALPAGDSDSDGDWDATDVTNIGGGYDIREDSDLDGDADFDDFTHSNNRAGGGAMSLGWKTLSSAYCANRKGYASYEHDAAAPATLAHVRYRVCNFTLGRWVQRDPAGYIDGANVYGYVGARAVATRDIFGLKACIASVYGGCGGQAPTDPPAPPNQADKCSKCREAVKKYARLDPRYKELQQWFRDNQCPEPVIQCDELGTLSPPTGGIATSRECGTPTEILIRCTSEGDQLIDTIIHALMHAIDNCALCNNTPQNKLPSRHCWYNLCTEARGYAHGSCHWKSGPDFLECVLNGIESSLCHEPESPCCQQLKNGQLNGWEQIASDCMHTPIGKPPPGITNPVPPQPPPPPPPPPPTGPGQGGD